MKRINIDEKVKEKIISEYKSGGKTVKRLARDFRIGYYVLLDRFKEWEINIENRRRKTPKEFICENCGKIIKNINSRKIIRFCSHSCKWSNENNPRYRNGNKKHSSGYEMSLVDDKYEYNHRKVTGVSGTEKVVHHIDGNRANNNLDNLMVFDNHSDHMKYHHEGKSLCINTHK